MVKDGEWGREKQSPCLTAPFGIAVQMLAANVSRLFKVLVESFAR